MCAASHAPFSRFATVPPARGSGICGLRLVVATGARARCSVAVFPHVLPPPCPGGARGRVFPLGAGADVRGAGVGAAFSGRESTGTWDVAPSCPSKSAVTYKLRHDKTSPGFFQSVPAAYGPAFHAAARLSSGMKRSGVLSTPTRSLSGTERGEGPFIHRTGNPRRRQASLFKNLYVRVLRPFPYRSSASSAAITPICPAQKMNIHRTRPA